MADENEVLTPEAAAPKTFKVPVRNAAPEEHEHQGKTFKIPIRGKQFSIPVHQPAEHPAPVDNLSKIEENIIDPKTGVGEGTYAIKVNGQVKQVPFSKVPHVAAIAPSGAYGHTNFATEADEKRYYDDLSAYEKNLRSASRGAMSSGVWDYVKNGPDAGAVEDARAIDERLQREVYGAERWDLQTAPAVPAKQPDPIHEPAWWRRTKKATAVMEDVFLGSSGMTAIPGMKPLIEGTDLDPQVAMQKAAARGDAQALQTLGLQQEIQKTFGSPLANVSGTQTFQKVFDPKSKNAFSRFATGTTKALEGMTSIENLYSLASIYAAPQGIAAAMGLRFQADLATSSVEGIAGATEATARGEEGAGAEAWGQMFGNVLTIAAMHYGEQAVHTGVDAIKNRDTTAILNDKAQDAYEKKFGDLTPNEKASVLYEAVEDANPKFKKRVDAEVAKLRAKHKGLGVGKLDPRAVKAGVEAAEPTTEEARQQRLQVAKNLTRQIVERRAREEAYKHQQAQREHQARQVMDAQERARQADTIPSAEAERGFSIEEGRTAENLPVTGLRKTTEREPGERYEPEPAEPAIPVTERRAAAGEPLPERTPQLVEADAKVQELTEQKFNQSFSALPVYRQKLAADWLEKNHPEQWEAFKATPAYEQHLSDVKHAEDADAMIGRYLDRNERGEQEQLAPGADLAAGTAKLILKRSNIDSVLSADPETHRDLNEHTERFAGRSFDSLDASQRIGALAEYLRTKPEKVHAFMTVDLTERMRTGQHVDLANMGAEQLARQRASLRMDQRDSVRRAMDEDLSVRMVTDERASHHKELAAAISASETGRSSSLDEVSRVTRGLTEQASRMGLGEVRSPEDLFRIESEIKALPARTRTPAVNEFLTRMRQVRAAAEEHVLREVAEATAAQFRAGGDAAVEESSRKVVELSSQAADLQQAADDLRAQGQKQEAEAAQQAADYKNREADAVVAGAVSVNNPAPPPQPKFTGNMAIGRATRVVSPGNPEGLPAHYALIEATDAQTSHMPHTYEKREGYNQNGQPRDYSINTAAQAGVETRANNIDLDQVLSNGATTMEGPPVIDQRAHVISGNGRMLSLLTSLRNAPEQFGRYLQGLRERSAAFGIDPSEVSKFKDPVLVKVLDNPVHDDIQWSMLGTELNRDPMMGMSESEQGVAMARLLSPEYTERLGNIINSLLTVDKDGKAITVREAMRMRFADIAQLMRDAGIISANKAAEFLDSEGNLTEKSKMLFENMMAGLTVTDPSVLENAPASIKDKLTRAGIFFVSMRDAGENWNLASVNTDAVRLLTRAQDAQARLALLVGKSEAAAKGATGGGTLIERYLHPERFWDPSGRNVELSFDGQPLVPAQHPAVEALAMALEESPRAYAAMMAKYADAAQGVQGSMFGAEHPADAFTNQIASRYDLKVMPEEWGAVAPMPEAAKVAIEATRGPLSVEPEVHAETVAADVQPDSSSVTEAIPEGPRNVQELRSALEAHPNIDRHQADALTQVFEHILPRAIGMDANDVLGNRKLGFHIGGEDAERPEARAYHYIEDGQAIIRLCDSADTSSFIHEMAHHIRRYLRPADQAIANEFVGAKPGEEWTEAQEEKFAQAFERYHFDGGIRRGKLEQVFATLHRAMQSIYNAVKGRQLAKGTSELNAMFDNWYDWSRAERKPITLRTDVEALEDAAKAGKVDIPKNAKLIEKGTYEKGMRPVSADAQTFLLVDKKAADAFVKDRKNGVISYEIHQVKGKETAYVRADIKKGIKLYQPGLNETIELAKRARELEAQLKKEQDPRRQALLRGQINDIDDKLRGTTGIIGGKVEPKDTSATQLIYGVSEHPRMDEPTTPAQAVTVQQVHGDPTGISLGGKNVRSGRVPDETPGVRPPGATGEVHGGAGQADGEHAPGGGTGRGVPLVKPEKDPLAKVKAANLDAPERPRGTPVVDPEKWRGYVDELGLPKGTPPPTVRVDPDVRSLLIFPGQPEVAEGVLSALQQYDATVLASPAGSGKNYLLAAISSHLLGTEGDKIGLWVTRSQNLIHDAGNMKDVGRMFGVDVNDLPSNMADMQTGMYAATYAGISGNRELLRVPWDFVLFDESDSAAKWTQSDRGEATVLLAHAAKKVVYSSATPYGTVLEMGYMHKLGLWRKEGFARWAEQFGLVKTGPNEYAGGSAPRKLEKLRQQLIERGQWQQLHKDMEGTSAHVVLIPQTEDTLAGVRNIRKAFAQARSAFQRNKMAGLVKTAAGHEAIYLKRYLESAKLPHAIEVGKKAIADGWAPVFFTEYRSPAEEGMDFINRLPNDEGQAINAMLPPLPDIVGKLRAEFGDKIGIFAGAANQLRAEELDAFQSGEKDALYATYAAGGVGASAHDLVGDRPRLGLFISLPWSSRMLEQASSRTDRYGRQSEVANIFLTTDALPEMKLLATKALPRMAALKAAIFGWKNETQFSKNLREAVGLPQELVEYDQGQEYAPESADFEKTSDEAKFTHISDFDLPDAKKAMNKPMKYKGQGRKLYQGPAEESETARAVRKMSMEGAGLGNYVRVDRLKEKYPNLTDAEIIKAADRRQIVLARYDGPRPPTEREVGGPVEKNLIKDDAGEYFIGVATPRREKLYQGPKDEDPWQRAAREAMENLLGQTRDLPAPTAHAIRANEGVIRQESADAGRKAMGSGEPAEQAAGRKARDMVNDVLMSDQALIAAYKGKGNIRNIGKFLQSTAWMLATSGDKVVEKTFKSVGMEKEGEELKRRMIDFDLRKGLYQGRMQAVIREIVKGNDLKPKDIELMSKVVEGQTVSDDPRINKAAKEFRAFTNDVRQALGDAGSVVLIYEDGIRKEIPYSAIDQDPHYWPRMYDWNKPFTVTDKTTGKKEVHTLAEIMNMPTSDARREKIVDQFAEERGISKMQARQFFKRNDRGIRLAGNVERAREWNIPTYGRDREAIERYIDQVATTLAATEVHGQFRQKTDPIIEKLPAYEASLVNRIVTSDLDPAHLPPTDRTALSATSAFIITGKMFYSPIKVLDHLWKASLATNTRSLVGGLLRGITSPGEVVKRARDANALLDYTKSAWMREYGMKRGNIGQKFLDFNGFTLEIQASRVMASAMGRLWFEKYVYPELVKNPESPTLRAKLGDLYGMSKEHIDNIIKNGYGPDDVRRIELGAANWVTGSNRPSEMPPAFRASKDANPVEHRLVTLFRMTQMLHGFMFKTANLVNRTVFERLYKSDWKSIEPYHVVTRFAFNAGLAGFALEQLLHLRHQMQGSSEAEIEKHRHEWLEQHPASAEALWWSMANMSMAVGIQPLSDLFNEMATRNPKDRQKLASQHRFAKGVIGMPMGIPGQDVEAITTASEDYINSFSDTGKHKLTPEERRENILKRLAAEEIVGASLIPGMKPKIPVVSHHPRRKKTGVL